MTTVAVGARGVVTPERFARGMTIEASAGIDEILSALHEQQLIKETVHGDA